MAKKEVSYQQTLEISRSNTMTDYYKGTYSDGCIDRPEMSEKV